MVTHFGSKDNKFKNNMNGVELKEKISKSDLGVIFSEDLK